MSIIHTFRRRPGQQSQWLRYRGNQGMRMTGEPCRRCGREPQLREYVWREMGLGFFCESCAIDHLGVKSRLHDHAPVTVIYGDQLDRGDQ
ncbi:hypothetical protein KWH07_11840 [Xanthomonas campestris pv. zingibericola]|uniref:hypothetical protein n=1 Tax=Xanthomonas euvesicatoria TaxID=456327 RepID=UPI001C43CA13|nr:hypothetical protein [Xanthomonas euvesicatoria]MBV6858313.1 hypothetical protein [Xanthomonas campestris pv. zingibericola]